MDTQRTCMISQPRYLPAMAYLKRISKADVFIVYDSCQRDGRGYENRNKLKDDKWLTIPVQSSSRELIMNTQFADLDWIAKHKNKIRQLYSRTNPIIEEYYDAFKSLSYRDSLTQGLLTLMKYMEMQTEVIYASDLDSTINGGVEQLIKLTKLAECDRYISGEHCLKYGLTHDVAASNGLELIIDKFTGSPYGFVHDLLSVE